MVIEVNQIILENFESFLNKNPNAPISLRKLFKESLRIESDSTSVDKKGIQKTDPEKDKKTYIFLECGCRWIVENDEKHKVLRCFSLKSHFSTF